MTIIISTGLSSSMLDESGETLGSSMSDGQINIYSGDAPDDADGSIESNVLLVTISDSAQEIGLGKGLRLDLSSLGSLAKPSNQLWSGFAVAKGDASFFRFIQQSDTGKESDTEKRIQGTVSEGGDDLNILSTSIFKDASIEIWHFSLCFYKKGSAEEVMLKRWSIKSILSYFKKSLYG